MTSRVSARQPAFAALQHRGYRGFVLGNAVAMMADNTEHVISYWVLHQKFHSPALGAFAVISHWVPFLLLAGYAGALADRYNPRRMIQFGMMLFMAVSVGWGLLFLSGSLHIWQAWVLLTLHGIAGVLWTPPSQVLIHDIVGPEHLQSAVRLSAQCRVQPALQARPWRTASRVQCARSAGLTRPGPMPRRGSSRCFAMTPAHRPPLAVGGGPRLQPESAVRSASSAPERARLHRRHHGQRAH